MGLFGTKTTTRIETAPRVTTDGPDWKSHIRPLCCGRAMYGWTDWPCHIVGYIENREANFGRIEIARDDGLGQLFMFDRSDILGRVALSSHEKAPEHTFTVGNPVVIYGLGDRSQGNRFYPVVVCDVEDGGLLFTYDWFVSIYGQAAFPLKKFRDLGISAWGGMTPQNHRRCFLSYYVAVAEVALKHQGLQGQELVSAATRLGNEKFNFHWQ